MLDITKDKSILRFCWDKTLIFVLCWIVLLIPTGASKGDLDPVRGISALFNITISITSGVIVAAIGLHFLILFLYFKRYEKKNFKGMYGMVMNLLMGIGYVAIGIIFIYATVMYFAQIQHSSTTATSYMQEGIFIVLFLIQIPAVLMDRKIIKRLNRMA